MTTDQLLILVLSAAVLLLLLVLVVLGYLAVTRSRAPSSGAAGASPQSPPLPQGPQTPQQVIVPGFETLAPAFGELRGMLGDLQGKLEDVRAAARAEEAREVERRRNEDQAYQTLQRLSATLLGSAKAGATGERIVEEALNALPPQWRVTNHTVANKRVEFAIRLPDGLLLSIDSKVVAQSSLDMLEQTEEVGAQRSLERSIRDEVLQRAKEVRQYVDERSPGFALAAVPDAAYRLCGPILPAAYRDHQVLIIPYSLVAPFALMVYEQHRANGITSDLAKQAKALGEAENHVKRALDELNGRMGNALVQLRNGHEALGQELARAGRALESIRSAAAEKVRV